MAFVLTSAIIYLYIYSLAVYLFVSVCYFICASFSFLMWWLIQQIVLFIALQRGWGECHLLCIYMSQLNLEFDFIKFSAERKFSFYIFPALMDYFLTITRIPCLLFILSLTELVEDIPSVKKSIQQVTSQASKLLHPHIHDNKKIEVSDTSGWTLMP